MKNSYGLRDPKKIVKVYVKKILESFFFDESYV
jgi:hypothetical protein